MGTDGAGKKTRWVWAQCPAQEPAQDRGTWLLLVETLVRALLVLQLWTALASAAEPQEIHVLFFLQDKCLLRGTSGERIVDQGRYDAPHA